MEAVLLSTSRSFLIVNMDLGKAWARVFITLKNDIDKSLSTILSLNTIAHTVCVTGVGAQAIMVFGDTSFGIVNHG